MVKFKKKKKHTLNSVDQRGLGNGQVLGVIYDRGRFLFMCAEHTRGKWTVSAVFSFLSNVCALFLLKWKIDLGRIHYRWGSIYKLLSAVGFGSNKL
jgi:hypothetical protein